MSNVKGLFDRWISKWMSRKLMIVVLASYYLQIDKLNGDTWAAIALGYIGLEGTSKIAALWKHGPRA